MPGAGGNDMKALVGELIAAHGEFVRLASDRDSPALLGAPCSAAQIAKLETKIGAPLPPSYRAFLELHNGWEQFDGDGKILAVEDHAADWVKEKIALIDTLFAERGEKSPFEKGALPVMLGEMINNYVTLDPSHRHAGGEMAFHSYDLTEEEDHFDDFYAVLQDDLEITKACIAEEKVGLPSPDDEGGS